MGYSAKSMRARLMIGAAVGALVISASPALARETSKVELAPQSLASALYEFGRQTGRQVIFSPELTKAKATRGVSGVADEEVAMAQLLAGTGLTYRHAGNTFMIVGASDPQSGSAAGDGAEGTVQALIVTAQKREEDIQDVPIAISAFTQEDLTRSQVAGGPDLMTQVPNMTFTKTNFSSYSIQIRGIGTQAISATTDAAVAVAFNNTPFIRNRFFEQEFYDLERVEVLRGPQGTLYGRNATAGVVNIISAKPKFTYESKLSLDVGNYSSSRLEGMVNVPLVDDKVALRIAGAWTKRDGYDTNQITGNQIDGRNLWSTRVSLRFVPTDRLNTNLIWEHFQEDDDRLRSGKQLCHKDIVTEIGGVAIADAWSHLDSPQGYLSQGCKPASLYSSDSFQTPNGFALPYYQPLYVVGLPTVVGLDPYLSTTQSRDLRVIESTVDPHYKAKTDLLEWQVSYDLTNHLTLTSETGYLADRIFSTQDYNRFNTASGAFDYQRFIDGGGRGGILDPNGVFCDPQIGCADRLVAIDLSTADSRHFSEELRVASDFDGPLNFSLGGNFLRYDTEEKYYVFINTLTMYAALAYQGLVGGGVQLQPDYVSGQSDNTECLRTGQKLTDPNAILSVSGCIYIDPNPIGSLNDRGHNYFLSRNPYKLISYAAFGEVYYNFSDALKITGGLRWTVDRKEAPRIPSWVLATSTVGNLGSVGYPVAEVIEQEWSEPTGRLTVDWKPKLSFTDSTLLYASYAHGYKAGGANPPANGIVMYGVISGEKASWGTITQQQEALAPKTFKPEFVEAFELGSKNTLLDGRLTLNADGFYYDYTGYQISEIVNRAAINLNFDADIWGLELEADWRPLENLRLGLKGGYENTRVADGSSAVDLMDRTAGHTDWVVVRPFPTIPSNCILPVYVMVRGGIVDIPGQPQGGNLSGCELAYGLGVDPITELAYVPNPTRGTGGSSFSYAGGTLWAGYQGFNPATAPNGGAGFSKDLSGNDLPNAPHYTATLTADYTLPLPNAWFATLHTDLYYQSEAWTRIFNDPGYDKLKAYTNVNLAAIFTNEDAGWKIMAYVKNIFDRDSITGAFLNSDDTGLTTNVFLTEPRLYGLRVTKEWTGGPWWTGADPDHTGPYPLTVELGGQVQRYDASYESIAPGFVSAFPDALDPTASQHRDLDWGDGRELRLKFQPLNSVWRLSGGYRYGRTNSGTTYLHNEEIAGPKRCAFTGSSGAQQCSPTSAGYNPNAIVTGVNWSDSSTWNKEEFEFADFSVERDVGFGLLDFPRSAIGAGLRYGALESTTRIKMAGIPDWVIPNGWFFTSPSTRHNYEAALTAQRKFEGLGPVASWNAATKLLGGEGSQVDVEWSLSGGVLFGRRTASLTGEESSAYTSSFYGIFGPSIPTLISSPVSEQRKSSSVSVPLVDLSLGVSYEIQRIKIGAGYRWERYFGALDVGSDQAKNADRTIDGPYFKLAIGFGD